MTIPKLQAPLATVAMPVQAKLAAAWASLMFLYIYVDYYHRRFPLIVANPDEGELRCRVMRRTRCRERSNAAISS